MLHIKSLSIKDGILPDLFWSEKMTLPLVHYKSIVWKTLPHKENHMLIQSAFPRNLLQEVWPRLGGWVGS